MAGRFPPTEAELAAADEVQNTPPGAAAAAGGPGPEGAGKKRRLGGRPPLPQDKIAELHAAWEARQSHPQVQGLAAIRQGLPIANMRYCSSLKNASFSVSLESTTMLI